MGTIAVPSSQGWCHGSPSQRTEHSVCSVWVRCMVCAHCFSSSPAPHTASNVRQMLSMKVGDSLFGDMSCYTEFGVVLVYSSLPGGKIPFPVYDWFLKCRICVTQSLLDFRPPCWHWNDRQPGKHSVKGGIGKLLLTDLGPAWTWNKPRLAKREALEGGIFHIDFVFTLLSSPYYPPQARTCVGQLQSLYAANLKEMKSILGLNDESIRSDL